MGRLLGVGDRKERSEGKGTGLPWDEAEGPIPLATKLPRKASPAERKGAVRQPAGHRHLVTTPRSRLPPSLPHCKEMALAETLKKRATPPPGPQVGPGPL